MPWVKIDDMFPHHPKVAEVGPLGLAMYVAGLCYSSRYLTDGFIPRSVIPMLLDFDGVSIIEDDEDEYPQSELPVNPVRIAKSLTDVGLWHQVSGGYQIHDYLKYQPSGEQVKIQREQNAERQKAFRERQKSNGDRNGVTNGPVTAPPNPNPNSKRVPSFEPKHEEIARELAESVTDNNPRESPPSDKQIEDWANTARLMEQRDNRDIAEMYKVMRWSQQDSFWRKNIKSMGKFREKYARLWEQMSDPVEPRASSQPTPLRPKSYDNDLSKRRLNP